jgi:hypothetical protein
MPIYNNPAIGQAVGNLAGLFAPPSGSDAAGWAVANAKRAEAKRLADLDAYAASPDFNQDTFDRRSIVADLYDPSQSFRAIDMDDATKRYGVDVGATTSRANNAADNELALADRGMQEAGSLQRLYAAPIKLGQGETALLPGQTAGATGLSPVLSGAAKPLSSDEVIAAAMAGMPGFPEQAARDKFAPSATQVEGQDRRSLRESGQLTDQDVLDAITGSETPVMTKGPGGNIRYQSPGAAIREGSEPYLNRGNEAAPKVENWIGPDGRGGIAVFDRDQNQFVDTTTKQPLPAGSRTYTGQLTGGSEATGFGKTTEAQDRNAYAATMAEEPTNRLLKAFDTGQLPTTQDYAIFNVMKSAPTIAAPALVGQMSDSGQLFYQDLRTALPFQLMTQSGAAVTEQEYDRKLLELIPVPGEADGVTKAKRQQFATYIKAVRGVSGAAYDKIHDGGNIAKPELPGASAAAPATAAPVRVSSPVEALKLPSGTAIILPDGTEGRVP